MPPLTASDRGWAEAMPAPRGIPDGVLISAMIAMRQRVLIQAPPVAAQVPLPYLPRPCVRSRSPLDLDASRLLIAPTRELVVDFLRHADVPGVGQLVGAPHHHDGLKPQWGQPSPT